MMKSCWHIWKSELEPADPVVFMLVLIIVHDVIAAPIIPCQCQPDWMSCHLAEANHVGIGQIKLDLRMKNNERDFWESSSDRIIGLTPPCTLNHRLRFPPKYL